MVNTIFEFHALKGSWRLGTPVSTVYADSFPCVCFLPAVSSMGNGTSRLYSALTKTLNSSAAAQHPEYLVSADPEHLEPIDPKELLEECRAVLHTRPPRYQRGFVDIRTDCLSSYPPIRVMQWNILAQGMPGAAVPDRSCAFQMCCMKGRNGEGGGVSSASQ